MIPGRLKLIALGRDGVVNKHNPNGIRHPDQFEAIEGSLEAIARLNQAGFRVVVTSNQQALGEGELNTESLHDIHAKMLRLVHEAGGELDAVFIATTGNAKTQGRRQPKVALLEQIQQRYHIKGDQLLLIGDGREDLEAAAQTGTQAALVLTGTGRAALSELADFDGVTTFADLASATSALLELHKNTSRPF